MRNFPIINLALAFVVMGIVAGCGQKGPLLIPEPPSQIGTAAEPDEEEDEEQDSATNPD